MHNNNLLLVIASILGVATVVVLLLIRRSNRMKQQYEEKLELQDALQAALTEAEEANDKLRALSETDPMTGVKSKRGWLMKEKQLDEAIGEGSAGEFAVVVSDVNDLKKVNNTYGHKAGDECIREACRMVCEIFQHSPV